MPSIVVTVAQLVEPRLVVPVVAGSSPVGHPISHLYLNFQPAPIGPPSSLRAGKKLPGLGRPGEFDREVLGKDSGMNLMMNIPIAPVTVCDLCHTIGCNLNANLFPDICRS